MKNKMDSELSQLTKMVDTFSKERNWEVFHTPKNLSTAMSVECSELLEIFQWMTDEESMVLNEPTLTRIKEEIADVQIYLLRLTSVLNINISEAVRSKIQINEKKYPKSSAQKNSL